jgi:hypothetical protein
VKFCYADPNRGFHWGLPREIPKDSAAYFTGACPVQFFAEDERSGFNRGGSKNKNKTRNFNPVPLFPLNLKSPRPYFSS